MKNKHQIIRIAKNALITAAFPLAMYLIMGAVVYAITGKPLLNTSLSVKNLIRSVGISASTAFAISMNLTSGRMDLSLGSQRLLGTMLGGMIALKLGLTGIWLLVFAVASGILVGAIVGVLFVTMRIPPMVLGIGVACIYESLGFVFTKGAGLVLSGVQGISILADVNFTITVLAVVAVFMYVLLNYTRFSYELRAIRGSQKIAQDSGINIFRNVVICYTVAGGIVVIAGLFEAAFSGSMSASMGLTTNSSVMIYIFAMQLGMYLSKWSNQAVGIIVASLTLELLTIALIAFKISTPLSSSIQMFLFLAFLIWRENDDVLKKIKLKRARIAQAQAIRIKQTDFIKQST